MRKSIHLHGISRALILLLAVFAGGSAHAVLAPDYDFTQALNGSDLVVEGRVLNTQAEWVDGANGKNIFTTVHMKVDRLLKGQMTKGTIVFSVMGGTIGDGTQTVSVRVDVDTVEGAVYGAQWFTDSAHTQSLCSVTVTESEVEIPDLQAGQQYWNRVHAARAGQYGLWSNPTTHVAKI